MKSRPKISIVIPNYNHGAEIQYSLRAIVNQTRPADEVIVVDDGSTDNSIEIIQRIAREHKSVSLFMHEENQGVVTAVNAGVARASGDYIILASADERIMPDMCEVMERAHLMYPDALVYISKFTEWCPEEGILSYGTREEYDFWFTNQCEPEWISAEKFHALSKIEHVRISVNSAMFRKSAFTEAGAFIPEMKWYSDFFLIYSIVLRHGFCAVPCSLSWFKTSKNSFSSVGSAQKQNQSEVIKCFVEKLKQPGNDDLYQKFFSAPSILSAFFRPLFVYLSKKPKYLSLSLRLGAWWISDALRGNRPGIWANTKLAGSLRLKHRASALQKLNQET